MIVDGPLALTDLLGKLVVYRNLEPVDPALPRFAQSARALGLPAAPVPRKTEPDYARVVTHIIMQAAAAQGRPAPSRVLVVGDTRLNDGTAFRNLQAVNGWRGAVFIGSERMGEPPELVEAEPDLFLSNRWELLDDFDRILDERGLPADEDTVAVIDLDKTVIGARGRNDSAVDNARIEGVRATAAKLLGDQYDESRFLTAYHRLNTPPYHRFTADNQDYLVYICLVIGAQLRELDEVTAAVARGTLTEFAQFIEWVEDNRRRLADTRLAAVHDAVYERYCAGDPTPFKEFRYQEFRATIASMGRLPGTPSAKEALREEIVITREVSELIDHWRDRGAIVIGISDKPDEAALPTPSSAADGLPPLHEAPTHRVGASISWARTVH